MTDAAPDVPRSRAGRHPAVLVALVAIIVLAADQGTKYLAVHHLDRGERVDLIGSLFGLRRTSNPGAAFSMATGSTWIFTIIATVVVIVIIRLASRLGSRWWALALGLLLGGALGNLSDRLFREPGFARGHVVDFLEFPHWPIFNVADCCVVTAACLIALFSFLGLGIDGTRIGKDDPASSDQPGTSGETGEIGDRGESSELGESGHVGEAGGGERG